MSQSLQDRLNAGGRVHIPAGTYYVSSPLTFNSHNTELVGDGPGKTRIIQTNPNAETVVCHQKVSCVVSSISLHYMAGSASQATGLRFSDNFMGRVENVDIFGFKVGVDAGKSVAVAFTDMHIRDSNDEVFIIRGGNDHFLTRIVADSAGDQPRHGVAIYGSSATWMTDCDIIRSGAALVMRSDEAEITWCFFQNSAFDTGNNTGIYISATNHPVRANHFNNCWSSSNTGFGVLIDGNGGRTVDTVTFSGHRCVQNSASGYVAVGDHKCVTFDGCVAHNNAQGFEFLSGREFAVRNCVAGNLVDFGQASQQNGVVIHQPCTDYIVTGNMMKGNPIIDAAGSSLVNNNLV